MLSSCMFVHHMRVWCWGMLEESIWSPYMCVCWIVGFLKEWAMLFTHNSGVKPLYWRSEKIKRKLDSSNLCFGVILITFYLKLIDASA